jgi:hypothetical protein
MGLSHVEAVFFGPRERVVASIEAGASRHEAAEDRLRMW